MGNWLAQSKVNEELDFDLDDFINIGDTLGAARLAEEATYQQRVLQPRLDAREILQTVTFANAEAFADQISLDPNVRTFAWVSGSFIFGDIIEALVTRRNVIPKRLYVATLSLSQENVDSLKNVLLLCPELERLVLVMSGYQYSHEKYGLVPYIYQELDGPDNRVQIAFGGWHCKVIAMETAFGHTLTIHGSANLRSSNSIEQLMVEQSPELYEFNRNIMEGIAARFGTINHGVPWNQLQRLEGREAWEVSRDSSKKEAD